MRRFHRSSRSSRSRRKKRWEFVTTGLVGAAPGVLADPSVRTDAFWARIPAGVVDPVTGFPVPDDHTLLRTLGYSQFAYAAAQAERFSALWSFGLIAWDRIDSTVPPAAELPRPATEANWDWLFRQVIPLSFVAAAANVTSFNAPGATTLTLQSKARRKLSAGTGILAVCELARLTSNVPGVDLMNQFSWQASARFLLLEP